MQKSVSNLELLNKTFNLFASEPKQDLRKTYVFACQHILEPKDIMFDMFVDLGIPKSNIFILGKAYSTSLELLSELKAKGFNVEQPMFDFHETFDDQHKKNCEKLFNTFKEVVPSGSRVIVLDDGAGLLSIFNGKFNDIAKDIEIAGVEQTSSGFRKLESEILKFPIINVARSDIKLNKESPFIAESSLEKLDVYFGKKKLLNKRFLVIGLGPIGQAIVDLLQKRNEEVFGFDTALGHKNLLGKINELKPNVIIGATGVTLFSSDDIDILNSLDYKMYLVSVSSSDREFPVVPYRAAFNLKVHSDIEYKNIVFLNNGFPINFKGNRHEGAVEGIERTICLLLGSVLYLATCDNLNELAHKLIEVPDIVTALL